VGVSRSSNDCTHSEKLPKNIAQKADELCVHNREGLANQRRMGVVYLVMCFSGKVTKQFGPPLPPSKFFPLVCAAVAVVVVVVVARQRGGGEGMPQVHRCRYLGVMQPVAAALGAHCCGGALRERRWLHRRLGEGAASEVE